LYKNYPGLEREVERVTGLKERARAARREWLGDQVWQLINTGDYDAAAEMLRQSAQEVPGDAGFPVFREEGGAARQSLREARDLAGRSRFSDAVRLLQAALERNPGDAVLERELRGMRQQAERQAALEQTRTSVEALRVQRKFDDALRTIESFISGY